MAAAENAAKEKDQTAMLSGYYGWMAGFGGVGMVLGTLVWLALLVLLVWGTSTQHRKEVL